MGIIHQWALGGALQMMSVLLHYGFHCPLMPHWHTTGVKWLWWWTMKDYENNTLVKSSWNHFSGVDSSVNIPWSDDCKLCVCVTSPLRRSSNPVCAVLGPVEDRVSLVFACIESHGCMKVWGPLVHTCTYVCSLGCLMDHCLFPPSQLLCSPLSIMAACQVMLSTGLMTFYRPIGNHSHIQIVTCYLISQVTAGYVHNGTVNAAIFWPSPYCSGACYVTQAFIIDAILTAVSEAKRQGVQG